MKEDKPELDHVSGLLEAGEWTEAEARLAAFLANDPGNERALYQHGVLLAETRRFEQAEAKLRLALRAAPLNPDYLAALGFAVDKQGRAEEARLFHEKALNAAPKNPLALRNFGIFWIGQADYGQALTYLREATAGQCRDAKAFNCLGIALQLSNRLDEAREAIEKALELRPRYENAHHNLISVLEEANLLADARSHLDRAKELFPDSAVFVLLEATLLRREGKPAEAISLLRTNFRTRDPQTLIKAQQESARLHDLIGETDAAFGFFQRFNITAAKVYRITPESKHVYLDKIQRCRETFTPEWVASWPPVDSTGDRRDPVFLIGFPRSGTTLLQQILGAHTAVYAADEVQAADQIIRNWKQSGAAYPEVLAGLEEKEIEQTRQEYYKIHREWPGWREAEIFIDKDPLLMLHAGMLTRIFPNAKFIFTLRHPCDCVLSAYMQFFVPNEAMIHFCDLGDTARLYAQLMDMWKSYEAMLPLKVHYVRYEDLVGDFEGTVISALSFLGFDWEDDLARFHEARSVIRSASYDQVSEEIYDRARYRWHRYRKHLARVIEQLRPYAERFGYEI